MGTVLVPRVGGVLSALGLAISDLRRDYVTPFLVPLDQTDAGALEEPGREWRSAPAVTSPTGPSASARPTCATAGSRSSSPWPRRARGAGRALPRRPRGALRLPPRRGAARGGEPAPDRHGAPPPPSLEEGEPDGPAETGRRRANFDGSGPRRQCSTAGAWGGGSRVEGPAIVELAEATCVVRWAGGLDEVGTLVLGPNEARGPLLARRQAASERGRSLFSGTPAEPARRSGCPSSRVTPAEPAQGPSTRTLFARPEDCPMTGGRRSRHAVRALERAVRHRRGDGGRAHPRGLLLQHQGAARLLHRALRRRRPHGRPGGAHPVHLGAMPEAGAAVRAREPGRATCSRSTTPIGRHHLPDITLVSPIVVEDELVGYAVTRAHHSDVGGGRGVHARQLARHMAGGDHPPLRLVRAGEEVRDPVDLILANVRTPDVRRGGPAAQIAANRLGERAAARAGRAPRARRRARGLRRGDRLHRAPHPRGAAGAARRLLRGRERDRGRRHHRRRHPDPGARDARGRHHGGRLRGHLGPRWAGTSTARSRSRDRRATSRCASCCRGTCPPTPAPTPRSPSAPRRAAWSTPAGPRRSWRATWRRASASPTPSCSPSARRPTCPRRARAR